MSGAGRTMGSTDRGDQATSGGKVALGGKGQGGGRNSVLQDQQKQRAVGKRSGSLCWGRWGSWARAGRATEARDSSPGEEGQCQESNLVAGEEHPPTRGKSRRQAQRSTEEGVTQ